MKNELTPKEKEIELKKYVQRKDLQNQMKRSK